MSTLLLDDSGDLALQNNSLVVTSDLVTETAQRLKTKFRFFLGEWHLDPRAGIPYYDRVLVKNPDLGELRALYTEIVLGDTAVEKLITLSLDFDTPTRNLSITFEAELTDGSTLVFDNFVLSENL